MDCVADGDQHWADCRSEHLIAHRGMRCTDKGWQYDIASRVLLHREWLDTAAECKADTCLPSRILSNMMDTGAAAGNVYA